MLFGDPPLNFQKLRPFRRRVRRKGRSRKRDFAPAQSRGSASIRPVETTLHPAWPNRFSA
jgi:hypothetical protein